MSEDWEKERVCHQCLKPYEPTLCPVCQEKRIRQAGGKRMVEEIEKEAMKGFRDSEVKYPKFKKEWRAHMAGWQLAKTKLFTHLENLKNKLKENHE